MGIRRRWWASILMVIFMVSSIGMMCTPSVTKAKIVDPGYNEVNVDMVKPVGGIYTCATGDNKGDWTCSDSSIVQFIGSTENTNSATMTFLKTGKVIVTFRHYYEYTESYWESGGGVTGIWHSRKAEGVTVLNLNIEVKEQGKVTGFAGGNGTKDSPYLVSTKEQLAKISESTSLLDKHYKLINNIIFSPEDFEKGGEFFNNGLGWFPIGFYIQDKYGKPFSGVFDGNGYIISGLRCAYHGTGWYGRASLGLFGVNYGTIKNLGIENSIFLCYSLSEEDYDVQCVGAIAGINQGNIWGCYVSDSIIGGNLAGAITGNQRRVMESCYSVNNTFGFSILYWHNPKETIFGGLAGIVNVYKGSSPTIRDCYTAGLNFLGIKNSGAIAGELRNNTKITTCYYNNTDVDAFLTLSGTTDVKQLSDTEMRKQSSFVGFDFRSMWTMDSSGEYPYPQLKIFKKLEQALYITSLPDKTIYMVGQELDLGGGEVQFTNGEGNTYTYSMTDDIFTSLDDDTMDELIKGTISKPDMSTTGTKTVTIDYMGQTVSFLVYVIDSKMESTLEISCDSIETGGVLIPVVVRNDSQADVAYKYYSDSPCKNEIKKPDKAGTYYVRGFTEETEIYKSAESNIVMFEIGGGPVTVYNGVNYAAVYDYTYYGTANPDIKAAFGADKQATLKHFVEYGMQEGRQASEEFNVEFYRSNNADLADAFGNDLKAYYMHYINYGKAEGRIADHLIVQDGYKEEDYAAVYDYTYYTSHNADVQAVFGSDRAAILRHFVDNGMNEGRQGSEEFNVEAYRTNNPDLVDAFGNNLKAYYLHYIEYGKNEGRVADKIMQPGGYSEADYEAVYDYNYYSNANQDVAEVFGMDRQAILRHFVDYGMAEGRQGNEAFNVYSYRDNNPDLADAFGEDLKAYYLHYIQYGIYEGRTI